MITLQGAWDKTYEKHKVKDHRTNRNIIVCFEREEILLRNSNLTVIGVLYVYKSAVLYFAQRMQIAERLAPSFPLNDDQRFLTASNGLKIEGNVRSMDT